MQIYEFILYYVKKTLFSTPIIHTTSHTPSMAGWHAISNNQTLFLPTYSTVSLSEITYRPCISTTVRVPCCASQVTATVPLAGLGLSENFSPIGTLNVIWGRQNIESGGSPPILPTWVSCTILSHKRTHQCAESRHNLQRVMTNNN